MTTEKSQPATDPRPALLEEKLILEGRIEPLQKRLSQVNKALKDAVRQRGTYTDEVRGLVAFLEPRSRTSYDAELLRKHFPMLARGVIVETTGIDVERLEKAIAVGEITESELIQVGAMVKETFSQALRLKPLKEARPV